MNYTNTAVLLLGTNLGDRSENLTLAKKNIESIDIKISKITTILETEPLGFVSKNLFFNQIVCIEHSFSPIGLLKSLQEIEKKMGRTKKTNPSLNNFSSRIIDLDILFFNQIVFSSKDLTISHPQVLERKFVSDLLKEL